MSDLTREDIVKAARDAAQESDEPLTRRDFIRRTGITEWQINRLFPEGRWTEIRKLAGIPRHPLDHETRSDDELLAEFHRVVYAMGSLPTIALFNAKSSISYESYKRRFGGMKPLVQEYRSWLSEHDPESPLIDQIRTESRHEIPAPPPPQTSRAGEGAARWSKTGGPQFGPPLDFRGLRHAPINEQGVVYLFGVLSYELGFIVEAVEGDFPDCEAKRHIGNDRWQRVRIEFEYRSRNFRDHGHDPSGADLIVCWVHDWTECPLEVLELRTAIDDLES